MSDWGRADEVLSAKLVFRKGEILFGKIRPYFHKVCVAPVDGVCSSDTIVLRAKRVEYFAVALMCVSSDEFVDHATQTSQGTKMPRASWSVLTNYSLAMPPAALLQSLGGLVCPIVCLTQNMAMRNRNLRQTRDLLLPKLVSGEIDVSDLDITISGD